MNRINIQTFYNFYESLEFLQYYLEGRPLNYKSTGWTGDGNIPPSHYVKGEKSGTKRPEINITQHGNLSGSLLLIISGNEDINKVIQHLETAHEIESISIL